MKSEFREGKVIELSENQRLVLDVLERKKGYLSAYMILDELRDRGFRAPLQVYRALEKLISIGKVHRVESLNSFIACSHISCGKLGVAAFVICDQCERVQEVCDESVAQFLAQLADKANTKVLKSSIELHGVCRECGQD